MDKLDEKIDTLMRSKLVSLIQENAVRTKRINTKYTQMNKKHTLERWQAYYDSYEKMLKNIPKDLFRVEREVRQKFVSPISADRITKILTYINAESDLLFEKLETEAAEDFKKLGQEELYQERLEATRAKFKENMETHLQKCIDTLDAEVGGSQRLPVKELCAIYGLKESFLHELNLVDPLQKLHIFLKETGEDSPLGKSILSILQSLKEIIQTLQGDAPGSTKSVGDRKAWKMHVAKETMSVRDLMLDTNIMLEYAFLPVENRNEESIRKIWNRVNAFFDTARSDWSGLRLNFQSVYDFISEKESNNV